MIPAASSSKDVAGEFLDYLLSADGRAALEAQYLIVWLGEEFGAPVEVSGTNEALERPIGLHPPLLVAMDADKREIFTQRWRDSFPQRGSAGGVPAASARDLPCLIFMAPSASTVARDKERDADAHV